MLERDVDLALRQAAFDELRRLSANRDGLVRREEMSAGFVFNGERIPFALEQKGIWRPQQLRGLGAVLSVTTAAVKKGMTPKYDDQIAADTGFFEYRYQGTNPDAWENVAMRRAFELQVPIIYFYGVSPGLYEAIFPAFITADDPKRLTVQIESDTTELGRERLLAGGSLAPVKAYMTTLVKRRLHQHRFRELVVRAYRSSCTVCRLRHPELLDAAHILEDRDERGRPEVPNGLSLCKIHHGAYDAGILGIAPDYLIHIRDDILEETDGPMLRHGLQQMHGEKIVVPRAEDAKPNRDYLAERFERFRAA